MATQQTLARQPKAIGAMALHCFKAVSRARWLEAAAAVKKWTERPPVKKDKPPQG